MSDSPEQNDQLTSIEIIESTFVSLKGGKGYKDTSDATIEYNCLAWALGIDWARYDPEPHCAGYWASLR